MPVNTWGLEDYLNAKEAWMSTGDYKNRRVFLRKFQSWETAGNQTNPNETFRQAIYSQRMVTLWLSQVKVYDTVRQGYFTTGDLNVNSTFILQGYTPGYTLKDGTVIPEYAGDEVVWNGKIWVVADQLEPVQFGTKIKQVWYASVLRSAQRSGIGTSPGPS